MESSTTSVAGASVDSSSNTLLKNLSCDDLLTSASSLQEYETQLLGFTPKALCDGIHNPVLEYTFRYLDATINAVKNEFPDHVSDERAQKVMREIFLKVQNTITSSFDKLENYLLTNIFHIPTHVVLPEDSVQEVYKFTKDDEKNIDEELKDIKEKIYQEKLMEAALKQELSRLSKAQSLYLEVLQSLSTIDKTCLKAGDIKECLKFANGTADRLSQVLDKEQKLSSVQQEENILTDPSKEYIGIQV